MLPFVAADPEHHLAAGLEGLRASVGGSEQSLLVAFDVERAEVIVVIADGNRLAEPLVAGPVGGPPQLLAVGRTGGVPAGRLIDERRD